MEILFGSPEKKIKHSETEIFVTEIDTFYMCTSFQFLNSSKLYIQDFNESYDIID